MKFNYIDAPVKGLLVSLCSLLAPVIMLPALLTIKWDKEPSLDRHGRDLTIRGDLPKWLSWLSTPDERLPGGLYEGSHKALLEKFGKTFASWYWLGIRNRMLGMSNAFGKPADGYIPDFPEGMWKRESDGVWRYSARLGSIKFLTGYKVYGLLDGTLNAAPSFTVMLRPLKK